MAFADILSKVENGQTLDYDEWLRLRDSAPMDLFKKILCRVTGSENVKHLIFTQDGFAGTIDVLPKTCPVFLGKNGKLEMVTHTSTGEEILFCTHFVSAPDGFACDVWV